MRPKFPKLRSNAKMRPKFPKLKLKEKWKSEQKDKWKYEQATKLNEKSVKTAQKLVSKAMRTKQAKLADQF